MYQPKLNLLETEVAIKYVKDNFEKLLANKLNLIRVSAPLFVETNSGLNDNLSGKEKAISFDIKSLNKQVEIVHSLAKWKRFALNKYHIRHNMGLYTDMNAIRKDEEVDNIHSIYVDQWDWEKVIDEEERNLNYLFKVVKDIYCVLLQTQNLVNTKYPCFHDKLPEEIYIISSQDLLNMYPDKSAKEREYLITKNHKAVFIYQIGNTLSNNEPHDTRAADYDDWMLNGDILVYNEMLDIALELSSMGIRVDKNSLKEQLELKNESEKLNNPYCKAILNDELPFTIGGGIGQSRLCLFFLEKMHIGEVQSSIWSAEDHKYKLL